MKSVNLGFAAALLVLFASLAAQAQSPASSASSSVSAMWAAEERALNSDPAIQKAEASLVNVKAAYAAGVESQTALLDAQNALDQARLQFALNDVRSALGPDQQDTIASSLQSMIANREAQLALVKQQYQAGVASQSALIDAQTAVAKAKLRSDLYTMLTLEQKKLADIQRLFQVGTATKGELDKAQAELKKAQDAFAAAQP